MQLCVGANALPKTITAAHEAGAARRASLLSTGIRRVWPGDRRRLPGANGHLRGSLARKVVTKSSALPPNLARALRGAGLRATSPRLAVLGELVRARGSMTHAEVARKLAGTLDRATVYRNLVDLTSAGLVRRSDVGDHVWRFEWIDGTSHEEQAHPHFICGSCGTVTCLPEDAVSVKARPGAPRALKRRAAVMVQLRGTCDACS